ncbi:hypothetical protein M9H77_07807 [Catharanthus roseus]|uniref:Uncharacterized protein n=1 Tax=Catharanthus roseus TaxID=4058 RepID=A0ACC0BW88_CATRO|nr:hypothetical protein M9H77_07807 [Catharanthus roseus]
MAPYTGSNQILKCDEETMFSMFTALPASLLSPIRQLHDGDHNLLHQLKSPAGPPDHMQHRATLRGKDQILIFTSLDYKEFLSSEESIIKLGGLLAAILDY